MANLGTISTQDLESKKFSDLGSGSVAVNTILQVGTAGAGTVVSSANPLPVTVISGASTGYAEGTTVGTITAPALIFRGTGGTTTAVGTANGLPVQETFAPGAEDNVVGVYKVEQRFSYTNMVAAATTTIKGTATGLLHSITVNTPIAADSITAFDSASGTASTTIGRILIPGTSLIQGPTTALYDVSFTNGLVVAHTGTSDITVAWR